MMDILGLSREEINGLDHQFRFYALDYAWKTYNLRRIDLSLARAFGKPKEEKGFKINMTSEELKDTENLMKNSEDWTDEEKRTFEEQVLNTFGKVVNQ